MVTGVIIFLVLVCVSAPLQAFPQSSPSLGELARQERERKKDRRAGQVITNDNIGASRRVVLPGSTELVDPELSVRTFLPPGWKVISEPHSPEVTVACPNAAAERFLCFLKIGSSYSGFVPSGKRTITEADLQQWGSDLAVENRASSRELDVAGYAGHEIVYHPKQYPRAQARLVIVLATDVRRLYGFALVVDRDRFAAWAPQLDAVLESFSPLETHLARQDAAAGRPRLSAEELRAASLVQTVASTEAGCKELLGAFVSLEHMVKGCVTGGWSLGLFADQDPRSDPNYNYRVAFRADGFQIWATPRRKELGGFYCDGRKIYYNPQGEASARDQVLRELPK